MSVILPSLTKWTTQHLTSILKSSTQVDFDTAFDAFLAREVNITVNGNQLSREQYKKQLLSERTLNQPTCVKFDGTVEVPMDREQPVEAGLVGLFYEATIDRPYRIHAAQAQSRVTSSLNVIIAQDKSVTDANDAAADRRRVATLNQVITEAAVPVHYGPAVGMGRLS